MVPQLWIRYRYGTTVLYQVPYRVPGTWYGTWGTTTHSTLKNSLGQRSPKKNSSPTFFGTRMGRRGAGYQVPVGTCTPVHVLHGRRVVF